MHGALGYPEVITNIKYANVTTMALELRVGVERVSSDIIQNVKDGAYVGTVIDPVHRSMGLDE